VPESLIEHMREHGECLRVEMGDAARLDLLQQDYGFFADDVEAFCRLLEALRELRGRECVNTWQAAARAGRWREVFASLMSAHYDPLYERSLRRSFKQLGSARVVNLLSGDTPALRDAAQQAMA
jgi:tRNA 2-selenouridine synthase